MNHRHVFVLALSLCLSACGGGGSTSMSAAPAPASGNASGRLTLVIPARTASSTQRNPAYISPSTQSVGISINGQTPAQIVNVTPGSTGCTSAAGATTCVVNVSAPVGNDTFAITMYDKPNATGTTLGTATQTFNVVAGQAFNIAVTPGGSVAQLFLVLTPGSNPNTATVSAVANDADGNAITGPFANPVAVTSSGSVTLSGGSLTSSTSTITATGAGPGTISLSSGSQTASGQFPLTTLVSFAGPSTLSAGAFVMARGPDNNLWFDEIGRCNTQTVIATNFCTGTVGRIARVTPAGAFTDFALSNPLSDPIGMLAGPDGNMWFAELYTNTIGKISPSGQITEYPLPAATPNAITGVSTHGPRNPALGPDGNIWFAEVQGRSIGNINPSGTSIHEYLIPRPPGTNVNPSDITAGPDQRMWFTQSNGNMIGAITTGGTITEYPVPTPSSCPRFITSGPDGALWFTEWSNGCFGGNPGVGRITTSGAITEYHYSIPSLTDTADSIVAGPDGNLWFNDGGGGFLVRVTTSGQFTLFPLPFGVSPNGLAFAADGTLWYDDGATNTYGQFALGPGWTALPATLQLPGVGSTAAILMTLAETGNSGPFTVTSASPAIATVAPITGLNAGYAITGVTLGKTSITIVDSKGRMQSVPVDVTSGSVTLQTRRHGVQ